MRFLILASLAVGGAAFGFYRGEVTPAPTPAGNTCVNANTTEMQSYAQSLLDAGGLDGDTYAALEYIADYLDCDGMIEYYDDFVNSMDCNFSSSITTCYGGCRDYFQVTDVMAGYCDYSCLMAYPQGDYGCTI